MMAYLRLIRLPNLLLLAFTQWTVWYCLPIAAQYNFGWFFPNSTFTSFLLICPATILITAAGYIINDIADIEIDKINKPDKQWVGTKIPLLQAWVLYGLCNVTALVLGLYLESWLFFGIFVFCILALYLYSYWFKKMPLVGNLVVAGLSALAVTELFLMELQYAILPMELSFKNIEKIKLVFLYLIYIAFAFLATLLREIIKDVEDREGDASAGAKTLPIAVGLQTTRTIVCSLSVCLFLLLVYLSHRLFFVYQQPVAATYTLLVLLLPIPLFFYALWKASEKSHFSRLSAWMKLYMLAGLGLLWLLG